MDGIKLFMGYLLGVVCLCKACLFADLDMYVYNVGQANCILVTIDDHRSDFVSLPHLGGIFRRIQSYKNAIFFDTGAQSENWFKNSCVEKHIKSILKNEQNLGKMFTDVRFILSHMDKDHINILPPIFKMCLEEGKQIDGIWVGTSFRTWNENIERKKNLYIRNFI